MKKGIIIAGIVVGIISLATFCGSSHPEEEKEAYLTKEAPKAEVIIFPPMEIKANVTFLDFTNEEPFEIIADPKNIEPAEE